MKKFETKLELGRWFVTRKKYFYFAQYLGVVLPFLVAYWALVEKNGAIFWAVPMAFYGGIGLVDVLVGRDYYNHDDSLENSLKNDVFYDRLMLLSVPLYFSAFIFTAYAVANIEMSLNHYLAVLIGMGAMFSGVFCVSHELGHRSTKTLDSWGAKLSIALFGYGHFHIEHNRGHHVHVSTPEDAASARMGENLYQFIVREIPNTIKRAFSLEKKRLDRLGLGFWSYRNQILQSYAVTLVLYAGLIVWLGWSILPFLVGCVVFGFVQLSMANYLEHYGLLRKKLPNGRYEKCEPHHSWNSNFLFTNVLTLQLQRHSDHHANASRAFQTLRDYKNVPELPAGYPLMQLITTVPPLWRFVMDKRLLEFVGYDMDKVNMNPQKREQLLKSYAR